MAVTGEEGLRRLSRVKQRHVCMHSHPENLPFVFFNILGKNSNNIVRNPF